jgi:hypothetical protein
MPRSLLGGGSIETAAQGFVLGREDLAETTSEGRAK